MRKNSVLYNLYIKFKAIDEKKDLVHLLKKATKEFLLSSKYGPLYGLGETWRQKVNPLQGESGLAWDLPTDPKLDPKLSAIPKDQANLDVGNPTFTQVPSKAQTKNASQLTVDNDAASKSTARELRQIFRSISIVQPKMVSAVIKRRRCLRRIKWLIVNDRLRRMF